MERGDDSDLIPIDIILEILSRSSAKSIARFRLASKFCSSVVSGSDFTELFLSRSSTRQPRLLFAINHYAKWSLYSSPQPQNLDENHSLIVAADFHIQFLGDVASENISSLVSGLLYFPNMRISREATEKVPMICNPSTGQYAGLPQLRSKSKPISSLGYDPIGKQYKVLAIGNGEVHILTLGTGKVAWRQIKCPVNHYLISEGICINGILYYIAELNRGVKNIACFDVRYEKLWFLNGDSPTLNYTFYLSLNSTYYPWPPKLIDYKGKLGVIRCRRNFNEYDEYGRRMSFFNLYLWTLEDAGKQEWLRRHYNFPLDIVVEGDVSVVGVTADGEIILSMDYTSNPLFVFYFNPEKITFKRVGIQGFEAPRNQSRVYTFVNFEEDLKFI